MNTITAIFISVVVFILIMAYYTYKAGQEFEEWYQELLKQAPAYGFTQDVIHDFERGVFWQYHSEGHSPEMALKLYLSELN